MSDYLSRCWEAKMLGEMRRDRERERMARLGITEKDKDAARDEIEALWVKLGEQPLEEQLRRRERMVECAKTLGYIHSPDPVFDLLAQRRMKEEIEKLKAAIKSTDGTEPTQPAQPAQPT